MQALASLCKLFLVIGRDTLTTRSVIRLKGVVIGTIGAVPVITPVHMGVPVVVALIITLLPILVVQHGAEDYSAHGQGGIPSASMADLDIRVIIVSRCLGAYRAITICPLVVGPT